MWSFVSTSVSAPASIAPVLNPTKSGLTARNLEHASLFLPLLIYHPSRDVPAYSLHCISVFLYIFQLRGVGGRSQPTLLHLSAQAKTSTFAEAMSSSLYVVILGLWTGSMKLDLTTKFSFHNSFHPQCHSKRMLKTNIAKIAKLT